MTSLRDAIPGTPDNPEALTVSSSSPYTVTFAGNIANANHTQVETLVNYGYDPAGNLTSKLDFGGTTTYGYDANDQIHTVVDPASSTATTFTFNQDGQETNIAFPNGVNETMVTGTPGDMLSTKAVNSSSTTLDSFN